MQQKRFGYHKQICGYSQKQQKNETNIAQMSLTFKKRGGTIIHATRLFYINLNQLKPDKSFARNDNRCEWYGLSGYLIYYDVVLWQNLLRK